MTINNFKQEVWSAVLLVALRKSLVYAGPGVVNRDYEGEIKQAGDTVHISSVGDVTIFDYNIGDSINYEDVSDAGLTLTVDQKKAFAKKIDDIDRAQSINGGAVMQQTMQQAAYRLRDRADQYVAGLYTSVQAANNLGSSSVTSGDQAYDALVDLKVKLGEANVPTEGRYVIVPEWYHGLLLKNTNFINAEKAADNGQALRNGFVGKAAGFDILVSNNAPNPTGDDFVVQAGIPGAISYAEQIVETEALRLQNTFADAVRGLHVYGARLIRPDAIAVLTASRT